MPPHDPRECPDLERAEPPDADAHGEYDGELRLAEVLFGDGSRRKVFVRARQRDRRGRWRLELDWFAQGTTWTGRYVYDPAKVKPVPMGEDPATR